METLTESEFVELSKRIIIHDIERFKEAMFFDAMLKLPKEHDYEHLNKIFADHLLYWLRNNPNIEIHIYHDFVPHSFYFRETPLGDESKQLMNGGIIWHGGREETFAVTLESVYGWSIHT